MNPIILNFFDDFNFVFKVAFIVFVVVFVKQRITKNWLAITAIVIICIILIFFYWPLIGSAYVLYILITIGVGGVLVDTFFVTMSEGHSAQQKGAPSPRQMLGNTEEINESQSQDMSDMYAARRSAYKRFGGR